MQSATLARRGLGPADPHMACAPARRAGRHLGAARLRGAVRGGAGGLLRLPHLPDLRLLLRAAVGARPAAPAAARLRCLPRAHRAPAGDRLRDVLLAVRAGRRTADGARLDRFVRGAHGRPLPPHAPLLRAVRGGARGAADADAPVRRQPRRAGLPRPHLPRADRVGHGAGGRAAPPRHARVRAARARRPAAPRRLGAARGCTGCGAPGRRARCSCQGWGVGARRPALRRGQDAARRQDAGARRQAPHQERIAVRRPVRRRARSSAMPRWSPPRRCCGS